MIDSHLLTFIVGVIFAGGVAWGGAKVRQKQADETRQQLNGIGQAMRRNEWNQALLMMVFLDKREDRQALFNGLKK